ncbi:MAG: BamA/TamA family outer membrane protein [Acetobacteraceae bacterium]|nr:BamA/TamA family outer membrane protein [Acetobacteraceae bacterium]
MISRFPRGGVLLTAALLAAPSTLAADPQPYAATLVPTGDAALDTILRESSMLLSLSKAPVGPFALVTRARDDEKRLTTALESRGYYAGSIHATILGHPLSDPALPDLLQQAPAAPPIPVRVTVNRGPLFRLGHVALQGTVPPPGRKALDLAPGAPAVAADVLAAQGRVLAALRRNGYALATVDTPVAMLNPAQRTLDVSYKVDAGPQVDLGPIRLRGLDGVNPTFVRRRLLIHQGEQFNPDTIESARTDLLSLGVFSSVTAQAATSADPEGQLPITFQFVERPRNAISANVAYSTDLGASTGLTYTRRNLFGNAERLDLGATATQLGGTDTTSPGYDVTAALTKPDIFGVRNQNLRISLEAVKQDLQAYSRTAGIAGVTVTRALSPTVSGSVGVLATEESVLQEGVTRDYTLLQLPITATWDTTGPNGLLDPTHGIRVAATVTPTASLAGQRSEFVFAQLTGSTYINLGAPGRSVLALRATAATVQGASTFQIPPEQRLYAGGTGTVRGYRYQSVGPQFADRTPVGGTSLAAGTVEFRQRILQSFGAVVFADAGEVSGSAAPGITGRGLAVGAGVGARYYTSIGPVRLDFALPLIKQHGDDTFELYVGLGQAF